MKRLFLIACVSVMLAGCHSWTKSGWPYNESKDWHAFDSSTQVPKNVTLYDSVTGEELITWEIPAGYTLKVMFEHEDGFFFSQESAPAPQAVKWSFIGPDTSYLKHFPSRAGYADDRMELPGNPVRMAVTIRDTPELTAYPPAEVEPYEPTAPTTQPAAQENVRTEEEVEIIESQS